MSAHNSRLKAWGSVGLAVVLLGGCAATPPVESDYGVASRSTVGVKTWHFDQCRCGAVPVSWSIRETNPTESPATWKVVEDPTAPSGRNVMALTKSANYDHTYNLAIAENGSFRDLDLIVRVKAVSGTEDQGGGPIWRCRDENNYYISRFNPLESNFRVYVVRDGKRRQLDSVKVDLQADRWYKVRVTMVGDKITCYLDGQKMLEAADGTFIEAGMVGLWTKADAVTSFDDLTVRSLEENRSSGFSPT